MRTRLYYTRGVPNEPPTCSKHAPLGIDDIHEVWEADPLFYPAIPPAHWLMVAEVAGRVLVVPLAPPDSDNPAKCRPIGCYEAAKNLADEYRRDR